MFRELKVFRLDAHSHGTHDQVDRDNEAHASIAAQDYALKTTQWTRLHPNSIARSQVFTRFEVKFSAQTLTNVSNLLLG